VKMTLGRVMVALAAGLVLHLSCTPSAASVDIPPQLFAQMQQAAPGEAIPVIVLLADPLSVHALAVPPGSRGAERAQARTSLIGALKMRARTSQQPLRELLHNRGLPEPKEIWLINGMALNASTALIEEIAQRPEVASIAFDEVVPAPPVIPAADTDLNAIEDNIDLVNAPALWSLGYTGQGVTVAILDSGVDVKHPELGPRWRGGSNSWFNAVAANCSNPQVTCATSCDTNTSEPCDYLNAQNVAHGTGVAGVLVGGSAGGTAIGVAPGAQWIAAKIFDSSDGAPLSVIHQAFAWLLDPDGDPATDDAPDVVNGSWGLGSFGTCIQEFSPDIQALKAAGIAVVFSGGNGGPSTNTSISPANYPESFAVGSVGNSFFTQTTDVSSFSSRGPSPCDGSIFPEVVAPGFVRTTDFSFGGFPLYVDVAGTSFSVPHVVGVSALLLQAFPGLPTADLEAALVASAGDLGESGPDNDYGYGLVNALSAYNSLAGVPTLGIHDPSPPENDGRLDFGNVAPGGSQDLAVTLSNVGSGILGITSVGGMGAPFAIGADACSGTVLATGQSCVTTVRFAPTTHELFTGTLEVFSNVGVSVISLSGSGNTPPSAPALVFPTNGSQGVASPVTLGWIHPDDADGDEVVDELMISTSPQFETTLFLAQAMGRGGVVLAGLGLVGGLGLRRRGLRTGAALLLVLGLALVACGRGGGGGAPPVQADRTYVATNIASGTTYYWKVVSRDDFGGSTESAVWSFTTQ